MLHFESLVWGIEAGALATWSHDEKEKSRDETRIFSERS